MSTSPQDKGDLWRNLEAEQPPHSRAAYWVALTAAVLLLAGALALGIFLLNQRNPELGIAAEIEAGNDDSTLVVTATPDSSGSTGQVPAAATAVLDIAATVTLPATDSASEQVMALRFAEPPIVDADLTEWQGLPSVRSSNIVYTSENWDGSDDLEPSWQLGWDDHNLYIAVTVEDDIHAQNQTGNTIFRGDSLDVQIDTDRAGDFGPALSPDDFQITFSPGDFASLPPSAFRFQGTAAGSMLDAATPHNILMSARPHENGYYLEASIPWRDLNVSPHVGMELGLALNATDNDQVGVATQEIMKSNAPRRVFGDPTTWGTLILQ